MKSWSKEIQEDLILLIKDWLKQTGKTQSELCHSLNLNSARIPVLLEFLKIEFKQGGIPQVANRLCEIETAWAKNEESSSKNSPSLNSFGQLDLLDEICEDLSKIDFKK